MNKTITINLGGIIFNIEEDAYQELKNYLDAVKAHFSAYPDSGDIVADIEARMAEQLSQKAGPNNIVAMAQVQELIKAMGKVEEFGDEEAPSSAANNRTAYANKRLFRDPDNKIIFGVCAGLGHYFGVDPLIFRVILIALTFAGASGIIIYLILALLMPEAKTPAEKVQMRGGPVDINSLERDLKKKFTDIKDSEAVKNGIAGTKSAATGILEFLGKAVRLLFKLIFKIAGLALMLVTAFAFAGLTFVMANLLFNVNSTYFEFPLAQIATGWPYYSIVILTFVSVIIPVVFIMLLGASLLKSKSVFSAASGFPLLAAWFVAAVACGVLWVRFGPQYAETVRSLPQYQTATIEARDLGSFNKLSVSGADKVKIVQGTGFTVTASGRQMDLERLELKNEDGTLVVGHKLSKKFCLICVGHRPANITVAMPEVREINASGVTHVSGNLAAVRELAINLSGASKADIAANASSTAVNLSGVSRAEITGTSTQITVKASGASKFYGLKLSAENADVNTSGSSKIYTNAKNKLDVKSSGASKIYYLGSPALTQDLSGSSRVSKYTGYELEFMEAEQDSDFAPIEPQAPQLK